MTESSAPPKAYLHLLENDTVASTWQLTGKNTYRLGRGAGCDIQLPYSWVSRQHAMIQVEENFSHNIIDLGSANGTFVNGRRVYTPICLHTDDRIRIGKSEFSFVIENWVSPADETEAVDLDDETVAFLQKEMMTILVCDIRSFTPLSEEVDAGHISDFLALWTKKVDGIIRANGGQVDKFVGDAVLAVWRNGDDFVHVAKALLSALQVSIWTARISRRMSGLGRELRIGAALNTGEAVIGNIGVDGQRDYTIVGDAVNVAFRLEELTSRRKIDVLVGEPTFKLMRSASDCFLSREYPVRGKSRPLTAHGASFEDLRRYLARWKSLLV